MKVWKKFDKENPPEPDRFLVILSGYKDPHYTVLAEKVDFWGTAAYRTEHGSRIWPERMTWWTEIPKFDGGEE